MRRAGIAPGILCVVVTLGLAGCGNSKCPVPVAYSDAQLKDIQKARLALPKDSILHQVLEDYETERDDLRFCR